MKKICIVTGVDDFFGQREDRWKGLDVEKLKLYFDIHGFDTILTNYDNIINNIETIEDSYIFYTSSQNHIYRQMIEDVMFLLREKNILLPPFDFLKAHENKGYQELLRRKLGILSLKSYYFSNVSDIEKYSFDFPLVFKPVSGAGSKGVAIVNSKREIYNLISLKDKWYWKYSNRKKNFHETIRYKYERQTGGFTLQEFLPGLDSDYKVLVFGEKYYVVNRKVRPGDFRASGSGSFEHIGLNKELLIYAKSIFEKLGVPFASLDICKYNEKYFLIEFQCMHLGPLVMLGSQGYFHYDDKWCFSEELPDLEKAYSESVIHYIEKNNQKY